MSKLMDEFKEQIHSYTGPGMLSRQRIERIKETIPDVMLNGNHPRLASPRRPRSGYTTTYR